MKSFDAIAKQFRVYFLLALAAQSVCCGAATRLPAAERKVLEKSHFSPVLSTTNLPPPIVALCADDNGRLAEPGQKWEPTDVIRDPSLPRKRLFWAVVSGEHYVVHYERGGLAHSFHILVATLAKPDQKPKVVWRGIGGPLKDYSTFLDALRNGKLEDGLNYAH